MSENREYEIINEEAVEQENARTISSIHAGLLKSEKLTEEQKLAISKALLHAKRQKVNLMITGGTGVGKSSTINALFNMEKAKVGVSVNPETMGISKYELDTLTIWDTPGLGDGKDKDIQHAKKIVSKLHEKDENGFALIDVVLVIVDASNRDMGTSFQLINEVILKSLSKEDSRRVLVALNKADEANGGIRGWDMEKNQPKEATRKFLQDKEESVRRRIKESTGVDVKVVSYKAGFTDPETGEREKPWNLATLLDYIIEYTPARKRFALMQNTNLDETMWADSDELEKHRSNILVKIIEGIGEFVEDAVFNFVNRVTSGILDFLDLLT